MARNNFNEFSGYQFSPRSQFVSDPLRNPYEMEFRTPHGFPPHRPRESPTGFSPRQPFSSNRLKRPFPQNSSPHRSPYGGGNSSFQHSASTPFNANPNLQRSPNMSPYGGKSSFQPSPNFSLYDGKSSYQQSPSPSTTSNPSQFSRNSSGFGNWSQSSPKNTYQRPKFHRSSLDSNPGGSSDVRNYYQPSMVSDPWRNLKPSRVDPPETRKHYYTSQE